ncbi:hypothetical protein I3842_14G032500 [Carya illinoinensis]|uniref:ABC transporter domain-containing protein n=1 Tax=Carya illinoinensis TaxID=32201 RepID=A0A922AGH2_CARIL|nr:hypothetical protein I3842_14G032500 [Carya illinoinensis]
MVAALDGDELVRSISSRRANSVRLGRDNQRSGREDDEEELKWAALEWLPTYNRLRKGFLKHVLDNGRVGYEEVDVTNLQTQDKKNIIESILKVVEDANEKFLRRLRDRTDRVGIEIPTIEVWFEHLSIEGNAYVGTKALPILLNSILNSIEALLGVLKLFPSKKKVVQILQDVRKTTLLQAPAGKREKDLRVCRVMYCGHELLEFVPQRTCAYISQHDLHHGEMTVRETLDFSRRCLGVATRYEMLAELSRREKQVGIKANPEIDAFMKATVMAGKEASLVTNYILKILGLDICSNILVGDKMRRGISNGQKKRVTTGEMLVGPAKALFMDEISTGLDSSTTFQIAKFMRQMVHIMNVTIIISLLQPAPETFDLFDDIILLSEGQIVYQGPRENERSSKLLARGVADFLQEITSKKDQEQYWCKKNEPYRYINVSKFVSCFQNFHIGQKISEELEIPYDQSKAHPAALACLAREWLLMKCNSFVYIFKTTHITIMSIIAMIVFLRTKMKHGQIEDGGKFYGALFFGLTNVMFNGVSELALTIFWLPVFLKQRDFLFYPAWAFGLPIWLIRIPLSLMESGIWIYLTYYTVGFAPAASRFFCQLLAFFSVHQMALSLLRFIAALGRTQVVANTIDTFSLLSIFVLGGFIIAKGLLCFSHDVWTECIPNSDPNVPEPTMGKVLLRARVMFKDDYWFWICVGALLGFSLLFNICFILALTLLNPLGDSKSVIIEEDGKRKSGKQPSNGQNRIKTTEMSIASTAPLFEVQALVRRAMVLPFQPLSLAFSHVNYYVDMPVEMKSKGVEETHLQLLQDVSGAFRPGVPTALVGKNWRYIEGSISISSYPKNQATFAWVSGYCEQNNTHSARVTVYESLAYFAWLRLAKEVDKETRKAIMGLVELNPLRNSSVSLPKVDGLSTKQRKGLTIAVELVVNPSIIFMDEPTSGLNAIAAAIVMHTVRNTVDTSIDIFEAFDELLLMKRGGQVIYAEALGRQRNQELIKELSTPSPGSIELYVPTKYSQSFTSQCNACFRKQYWSYWRNPRYNTIRFLLTIVIGIIFGLVFLNKGHHQKQDLLNLLGAMFAAVVFLGGINSSIVLFVVAIERIVFYREKAAGMYSALPYVFGQVAVETLYLIIQTFVYTIILYSMIRFDWKVDQFIWFYFFIFVELKVSTLTSSYQIAAIQIPIWWRWYYWAYPVAWTLYGLVTSQVGDKTTLIEHLGFDHDCLGAVAAAHIGFSLLFFFVFAFGIKFLNFQRR